ncbi:MAG TPA: tetratricopeptide repeat protein [Rhizomicrobium sp.]|nr:tetratricopeptide repeat protein [Rhizomicrobium sp.]HVY21594.1 tetratricopeptide repeat protein [Bauldia sp.]
MSDVEQAKAHFFAALDLLDARDYAGAEQRLRGALAIVPDRVSALSNLAVALFHQGKLDEAVATANRVLALAPDDFEARIVLGSSFGRRGQFAEALAEYEKAVAIASTDPRGRLARGLALVELKRLDAALADFREVARLKPDDIEALAEFARTQLAACDWNGIDAIIDRILTAIRGGSAEASPFYVLALTDNPADQLACATQYGARSFPPMPPLYRGREQRPGERLRVAYVSNDFRLHPVGHLVVGFLEQHDHSDFEIFGVSVGPDDQSDVRKRIATACDHFLDARTFSDQAIAEYLRDQHIDVAVDLGGHTSGARPRTFAMRPAPVQAAYLGFPGTSGAPFIDYLLADPVVIPRGAERWYSEAVVRLPDSYYPNDDKRPIAETTPSRAEAGLPEGAFVFCCFNNSYKITPQMFGVWMEILHAVPDSVLWLLAGNASVPGNLAREAAARGIDPTRLVFAPPLPVDQHLARHRLADLSLDTLPYNAHTTGVDALWAGLPIITCEGESFAGRVASSVLHAIGLPELVTTSLDEFRALAIALATDPNRLAGIRAKVAANRDTTPLFDTARTTRHLESAYREMVARHRRGEAPAPFDVAPVP